MFVQLQAFAVKSDWPLSWVILMQFSVYQPTHCSQHPMSLWWNPVKVPVSRWWIALWTLNVSIVLKIKSFLWMVLHVAVQLNLYICIQCLRKLITAGVCWCIEAGIAEDHVLSPAKLKDLMVFSEDCKSNAWCQATSRVGKILRPNTIWLFHSFIIIG